MKNEKIVAAWCFNCGASAKSEAALVHGVARAPEVGPDVVGATLSEVRAAMDRLGELAELHGAHGAWLAVRAYLAAHGVPSAPSKGKYRCDG